MQRLRSDLFSIILLTLTVGMMLSVSPLFAADETLSPVNPAFTDFMLHKTFMKAAESETNGLGLIPSPVERSHLKTAKHLLAVESLSASPSSYDLRTLGRVTPVRNQGSCGSCWAFGAMGSLESSLMPTEPRDFSENNLKNTHGFDPGPCDGGGADMSTAYMMRWSGPVNESDNPYHADTSPSPTGLTIQKHAQNVIFLSLRASSTDNDTIKTAIMNYGAITAGMYWANGSYNSSTHSYYYNGSTTYGNHEIAIVGWDDNFDKTKFSPAAPGNGAFIIKNSWGTSWGENGYFYISYYDTVIGFDELAAFTTPESATNYGRIYSYDPLGVVGGWGNGSSTGWFANVFTAQGNDQIAAVSFYNAAMNSSYEVYIYSDLTNSASPRSGSLVATATGTLPNAGYLTIPLATTATVTSGHVFSAVVKLTTPGYNWPIPIEYAYSGYSSKATASAGQSFMSGDGTTWTDTVSSNSTMNVCLKVYSAKVNVPPPPTLVSPSGAIATATPKFTWNSVANATSYTLYRDDTKTSTLYDASTLGCSAGPPATCSITPATVIPAGSTVGWIVNATNVAGASAWSTPNFITYNGPVPAAPTLVSPSGAIATATPKFTWNSVANATGYTLYRDDTKTSTLYDASTLDCSAGPPATCSITPATVIPAGSTVGWIVNATNVAGASAWSTPNFITYNGPVPAAPTLVSPSGAIATATPKFTWNSVANATGYTLYRDDTKTSTLYDASTLGCSAGPPATCSITPATVIPAGSTVGWIVNAANVAGASAWSAPFFFSVP